MILWGLFINLSVNAKEDQKEVHVLYIDGAIAPAYTDYMKRGISNAEKANAELVLIELNTPGGLLTSTRQMVSRIMTSDVPVAVYVTPSGAHAASAGTFILMSAHIAAMDEGTNVGAATPVQMSLSTDQKQSDNPTMEENLEQLVEKLKDPNAENLQQKIVQKLFYWRKDKQPIETFLNVDVEFLINSW